MNLSTLLIFVPACFALNMAPGPNNLLSVRNAAHYGLRRACAAGAGRLLAFLGMIALASTGLAAVLHASALVFNAIKLAGAGYLFYIAVQLWRAQPNAESEVGSRCLVSLWSLSKQEFLVASGNPKAILIFTAFLPQFVDLARPAASQFAMLGAIFLGLECIALAGYAYMGLHMGHWLSESKGKRRFNRGCCVLLASAGAGLLAARRA